MFPGQLVMVLALFQIKMLYIVCVKSHDTIFHAKFPNKRPRPRFRWKSKVIYRKKLFREDFFSVEPNRSVSWSCCSYLLICHKCMFWCFAIMRVRICKHWASKVQHPTRHIIPLLHTDVSVRACTSCRPFLITSKEKGVVAELLDTVAKHRFVQKIFVLRSKFILRWQNFITTNFRQLKLPI